MAEQFPLFEFDSATPAPKPRSNKRVGRSLHTLFFAVFPCTADARAIERGGMHLDRAYGLNGKRLDAHRLHVTLHEVGGGSVVPRSIVEAACEAAASLTVRAFPVAFDRAVSFGDAVVLCSGEGIEDFQSLFERLGSALSEAGLHSKQSFTPHMTVCYSHVRLAEQSIEPIRWTAAELVLIDSYVGQHRHELLGRWPFVG